jgi:multiple sugar transport system substrate-binding protein
MKKTLVLLLLGLVLTLSSCVNKTTDPTTQAPTTQPTTKQKSENDLFWDKDENGIPDWQEEEITLTYSTWQYVDETTTIIDTLMVEAFTQKYPNIHVDMKFVGPINVDYEWDTKIQELAEVGDLPDVFLIYRLETALQYGLLSNITEYYNHDDDTQYIFDSVKNAGTYKGVRYAVPTFIYPSYWFVNLDILTNNNIAKPSYDWTWDQMEAIAQSCYNESEHIVGQYGVSSYWRELPKILSGQSSWAAFTYDGEKFNFDSPYFEQSFEKLTQALSTHSVTAEYGAETLESYYGSLDFRPEYDGYAAIWCAPGWEAKNYFDRMNFNWDCYPAPGGSTCGNIDIAGVSSTCAHKEAAYQLLKWMSFSEEGLITRYSLYKDFSDVLYKSADNYPYPVVDYGINKYGVNEVWDNVPYDKAPGMTSPQMINSLKNGALWANKEVVGWDAVDAAINSYFAQIYYGEDTFANLKETIVSLGNTALIEFREALDELLAG